MNLWKLRVGSLIGIAFGGFLFVYSIRDVSTEWGQIFLGLFSIFMIAMGFGLLIMPSHDSSENPPNESKF